MTFYERTLYMRSDVPELVFQSRGEFRMWLGENAETSGGVWLVFGKRKALITVSANEALEEALCFGWIDGQMQSIDDTKYIKYFTKRRAQSPWSEKNKKTIETLRVKGLMTESGEKAIEIAKKKGIWDRKPIGIEEVETLSEMLKAFPNAYEYFMTLAPSSRLTYTRWSRSVKSEALRQREFLKIADELTRKATEGQGR